MPDVRGAAASPATDAAAALLDELVRCGLQHVVVAPGSRSQALALAAADLERRGRVRLHVRIDERSAGFLALGLARASGRPAAVIVTSGTAVANLMPAVLEAHHSGVPLLLLTADRPPELRGIGANQATDQVDFFGAAARLSLDVSAPTDPDPHRAADHPHRIAARDAWRASVDVPAGPAHLNLPLREPLAGTFPPWWEDADGADPLVGADSAADDPVDWHDGSATIALAGADAPADTARIAEDRGWPLVAEVVSGARRGAAVVARYREALRDDALGGAVERVVVFGHPTLTRDVAALLRREDVDVVAVRGPGERLDLNGRTRSVSLDAVRRGAIAADTAWSRRWSGRTPDSGGDGEALDRAALVRAVWNATASVDRVVWASSRLVRVADEILEPRDVAVHANRGLAGIDGLIATASGIALAAETGVTRLVIGDLAFLHDVGSLLIPPGERSPRLQIIVGNDGGGTIFDTLEVAGVASADDFARVQYTPQRADLGALAAGFGWTHRAVTTPAELAATLASEQAPLVVEVLLER